MIGDKRHIQRIRFYEFSYVVPWNEIVARMEKRGKDDELWQCEDCGERVPEDEIAKTIRYPGFRETVVIGFCERCYR
mgnify:CR=1 FL=1